MEERMLTIFKRIEKYEERQDELDERVSAIEIDEAGKNSIYRILDKSVWLVFGVAIAFLFDIFKK
jgi:hypothetical protein